MIDSSRLSFLGKDGLSKLSHARIAVLGGGGGGSHVVQQLAHIGIGEILIVDHDMLKGSNVNRVVGSTLAEAAARGIVPFFFVKGGVAIELRLGLAARATKDLDVGLCAPPEDLLPVFDRALTVGFGDFVLRRKGAPRVLHNGVCSVQVSVIYLTRGWATWTSISRRRTRIAR